jgi:hypothetical protein
MISLIKLLREVLVDEGGNVFGTTSSIKKEYIKSTLDSFTNELKRIYPKVNFKFESLGSVGKKDESGDIDLGMSINDFLDAQGKPLLSNWNIDPKEYQTAYESIRKKSRTATESQSALRAILQLVAIDIEKNSQLITTDSKSAGSGSIFCTFPQYDESGNQVEDKTVQIDINVGNIDWLKFSYYSNTYKDNVKGLHRTQLMVALFQAAGMTFSHGSGVKAKDTGEIVATNPQEAIEALNKAYNINLTSDILNDYFELISYLEQNISQEKYNQVLDIYLKILDSTRADIPLNLQDYWIKNQDILGLKGKFLPDNSNLIKYKTA